MKSRFAGAVLLLGALALAGCNETLEDISPKATKPLPEKLVQSMKARGMSTKSPIMVRIFKEEGVLEVWKQKDTGRFDLAASYDICKWSGKLGPKFTEGDRQAPEGFYMVRPHQMNPQSSYHLAFNIGFPNAYDQSHGRTGQHLMVHGACSSAGCYSMTDAQVEQIYAFARDAFAGGQTAFQIQAFPFRMTAANMARYKDDPNYQFWKMLKEGYDHFEITKVPPKVDVCERRYVFNQIPANGQGFSAMAACPITTQPQNLTVAYQSYQNTYDAAFSAATSTSGKKPPAPSIAGLKEASLVADWSRRRARGERVTREPPTLDRPAVMMAEEARPEALQQTVAVVPTPAPAEAQPSPAPAQQAVAPQAAPARNSALTALFPFGRSEASAETNSAAAASAEAPAEAAPVPSATPAASEPSGGLGLRKRLGGLFGG